MAEMTNNKRVGRVAKALLSAYEWRGWAEDGYPIEDIATDMLTDLMHLLDRYSQPARMKMFTDCLSKAITHHGEEARECNNCGHEIGAEKAGVVCPECSWQHQS